MMKGLYIIKDDYTGCEHVLVFGSDEEAKRAFRIMANDKTSMLYMSPEDYSLWKIGILDAKECTIVETVTEKIENAKSVVRKENNEI